MIHRKSTENCSVADSLISLQSTFTSALLCQRLKITLLHLDPVFFCDFGLAACRLLVNKPC